MIRILAGPSRRLAALGILLAGINLGALALHVPGADTVGSPARANAIVAVVTVGLAVYLLAVRLVLRERLPRAAVWMILGLAVAMRAALVPAPPFLSSDIYRYVWDGQVQAAGINPYRYIPADPALEPLRDPAIYPLINRKDYAHTIYPPAAQGVFAAVGQVSRGVTGMKLAMLGFEAMGVLAMLAVLRRAGLPLERILIYAWNPLALWSFACDGHVDAVAVGLLGVALLARTRRRDGLAGALLAAATLVKVLPLAVAPAFVRGDRLWRPVLAGIAVIIVLTCPISASAGACSALPGPTGRKKATTPARATGCSPGSAISASAPRASCGPTSCAPAWRSPPSRFGSPSGGTTGTARPTPSPCAATPGSWRRWRPARRARTTPGTTPG